MDVCFFFEHTPLDGCLLSNTSRTGIRRTILFLNRTILVHGLLKGSMLWVTKRLCAHARNALHARYRAMLDARFILLSIAFGIATERCYLFC